MHPFLTAIAPQLTTTAFIVVVALLVFPKWLREMPPIVRELGTLIWSFRRRR